MSGSWWTRTAIVIACFVTSAIVLIVAFTPVDRDRPETWPSWYSLFDDLVDAHITPGLDLQGGLHVQYRVDVDSAIHDKLVNYAADIRRTIREKNPDLKVSVRADVDAPSIRVKVESGNARELVSNKDLRAMSLRPVPLSSTELRLDLDSNYIESMREDAISQSIETISRRIDAMGLTEPSIQAHGESDIIIQIPGVNKKRVDELLDLIETTAQLEFGLLSSRDGSWWQSGYQAPDDAPESITMRDGFPFSENLQDLRDTMAKVIPPDGTVIRYQEVTTYDAATKKSKVIGYHARLMNERVYLTGDAITSAEPAIDSQNNQPIVSMSFDRVGARSMGELTGENLGDAMVVVLDDVIVSIATIQGRITSNGQITMGSVGNYDESYAEAQRISMALRNGALVAPIEKQFDTRVGPSLGKEAVDAGRISMIVAFALISVVMIVRYRWSGLLADFAMLANLAFLFSILALFKATLTLPGIAGITLTLGMAVDANVIIFERIREELRDGRTPASAVRVGYEKAWSAIADGNLTTILTAAVLYHFGTGPVRGFAVTLGIGVACSMFSAIVITRLFFEFVIAKRDPKALSI